MNEILSLTLSVITGISLGVIFFGGLWWTIEKGIKSKRPGFWFSGSFLLRTGIILFGFSFIGKGHWQRMIACLLGFMMARVIVKWLTRPGRKKHTQLAEEGNHDPQS